MGPQQAGGRINKKKFLLKNVGIFGRIRSLGPQNGIYWPAFWHTPRNKNFKKPALNSKTSKPLRFQTLLLNKIARKLNFIRNRHLKRSNWPTGSGARPVFSSRQIFQSKFTEKKHCLLVDGLLIVAIVKDFFRSSAINKGAICVGKLHSIQTL